MLTPEQWQDVGRQASKIYAQLELEIIEEIADRVASTNLLNAVAYNDTMILQEMGILYQDIVTLVAKHNQTSASQIQEIFETAGVKSINYDDSIYMEAGLSPIPIKQSKSMLQLLKVSAAKTNANLNNLVLTTANTSQTAFYNSVNKAYLEVTTGVKSYSSAILDAIEEVAKSNILVEYPGGYKTSIENACRMNVVTGVNQTCGKLQEMRAEEMEWDLMEITAHPGARPEHAVWQGQIVSRSGQKGYLSYDDIGYGTAGGFKGVNCRHDWYPFYEGSTRTYNNAELQELKEQTVTYNGKKMTAYEANQLQRRMERQIRNDKKSIAGLQSVIKNGNKNLDLKKATQRLENAKLKANLHNSELNNFLKQTKFRKDATRLAIGKVTKAEKSGIISNKLGNNQHNSFGGSGKGTFIEKISKKEISIKLKEYEAEIRNKAIEFGVLIDKTYSIYAYVGDEASLNIIDRDLEGVILTHNHPEIGSFGKDDYILLMNNPKIKELRAVDRENTYIIQILRYFDKDYNYFYRKGAEIAFETGEEIQHCTMLALKKEGYVKYERIRKK